jgi:phosphoglycerate kinase
MLDDTRILAALPTIKALREARARLILCSHMGRPGGEFKEELSLMPVGERLAELLDEEVLFPDDCAGDAARRLSRSMNDGQVMLLENLRFHPGETANDPEFAEKLGILADVYVNDAFGAAHRAHASVDAVTKHFNERGTGLLMEREYQMLQRLGETPEKPFAVLLGGAKISSKLPLIRSLLVKADVIAVGGAMAYTFLKAQGHGVGKSLVDESLVEQARNTLKRAKDLGCKILLPEDHVMVRDLNPEAETKIIRNGEFPADGIGVDIGPASRALFIEALAGKRTIFWNGPFGIYEMPRFAEGTVAMARAVADAPGFTLVGGGDSAAAIRKAGHAPFIDHLSTGGGASLEFLEGRPLPGINALIPH